MNTNKPLMWKQYKEFISDARDEAKSEALASFSTVRSSGFWLNAIDKDGNAMRENAPLSDKVMSYREFLSDCEELINSGAVSICVSGDFDGADSLYALNEGNYEPLASEWSFDIWKIESGWIQEIIFDDN